MKLRTRYNIKNPTYQNQVIQLKERMKMEEESIVKTHESTVNRNQMKRQFYSVHVQIQFDQQVPLKMDSCQVSFQRDQLLTSSEKINQPKLVEENKMEQDKVGEANLFADSCITIKYRVEFQDQTKEILLLIPMNSIMCFAKKSVGSTILMLKDKEKEIQRDENGYQLVSDDEEEYQETQNQLYQSIKAALSKDNQSKTSKNGTDQENSPKINQIIIEQKCSIVMTIPQTSTSENNKTLPSQLYKYLSLKLQLYQKQAPQQTTNSWKNNVGDFSAIDLANQKFQLIQPQLNSQGQDLNDQFDQEQEDDQQIDEEEMDSEEDQIN